MGHEMVRAHVPVTYMLRNARRLEDFKAGKMVVNRVENSHVSTTVSTAQCATVEQVKGDITDLVVATKAYQTVEALAPYVQKLSSNSNILFIHNGMGVIEECVARHWPNGKRRPRIYKAIVTHGAYKTLPSVINHVGLGRMVMADIGTKIEPINQEKRPNIPQFIEKMCQIRHLNASVVDYRRFLMEEIDKLVVNACVNPMTALMDCLNGDLLKSDKVLNIFDSIIWETLTAVKKEYLVELRAIPEASMLLDQQRLLQVVLDVIRVTKENSSSMREDVRSLNKTEIDYINGYVVGLGRKHGVNAHTNRMLVNMVKAKQTIEKGLERDAAQAMMWEGMI